MKEKEKTFIDDSNFMEFIDEIATQITEQNFGENTWTSEDWDSENEDHCVNRFTEQAQDFYNKMYDEYETMANNIMGVYKYNDMIMHVYPNKNK